MHLTHYWSYLQFSLDIIDLGERGDCDYLKAERDHSTFPWESQMLNLCSTLHEKHTFLITLYLAFSKGKALKEDQLYEVAQSTDLNPCQNLWNDLSLPPKN